MRQLSPLNLSHQHHLIEPESVRTVTLIGVGSVGSHVAMLFVKSGVTDLTAYDDDSVESHNVPMSIYGIGDIGRFKGTALHERIEVDCGVGIGLHLKQYTNGKLYGTVVACVDSMQARANIWREVWGNPRVDLLVDTRTYGAYSVMYVINPHDDEDVAEYQKSLHSDVDALRQSCGIHGAGYATVGVAGDVVSQVVQFWQYGTKKRWHAERRDLLLTV